MTDLGYRESERDREMRRYTWEVARRLEDGLEVGFLGGGWMVVCVSL